MATGRTFAEYPTLRGMDATLNGMATVANTVPILRKAIQVLEAVARDPAGATTKNLAFTLGIPPTTCYRIMKSYVSSGWLRPRPGGAFELSTGLVPVFRSLLRHEILVESVREPLAALTAVSGLTAKLTVRQGRNAVTIHSVAPKQGVVVACQIGLEASLAVGSSGAVHLSACSDVEIGRILDSVPMGTWRFQRRNDVLQRVRETRRQGVCFDRGSYTTRIQTVSAPLLGRQHEVIAAITLLGLRPDLDGASRDALVRELKVATDNAHRCIAGNVSEHAF